MSSIISLNDRHTDATQKLIISTAIELLQNAGVEDLTIRAVAKQAGMSERTVFRYFPSRDEFLDAVAAEAVVRMHVPPPPTSIAELAKFTESLYRAFEANASLVTAGLHTEIVKRVRAETARERWNAISALIDKEARHLSKRERKIAATNISYFLSASTWHYYRSNFELSLSDAIACARTAIRGILGSLEGQTTHYDDKTTKPN